MPLGSMGVVSTALSNMQRNSDGLVQPLDAIEARRMKRQAAANEAQKAEAAQLKAQAAKQAADEQQRAGEAKRLQDAQNQAVLRSMPKVTVENMNDPQFTQQLRGQVKHMMNSGNAEAITAATAIMKQVETFSKTGAIDAPVKDPETGETTHAGTMQSEQADIRMDEQTSQIELNRSMTRVPKQEASAMDEQWANAYIVENDPGKKGISAAWTPNMSMAETQRKSAMLMDILTTVKKQYSSTHGGQLMPSSQAYDLAIFRFETMMEREQAGQAYSPAAATPAPPGGTPIMAETPAGLPPGTTGVTGGQAQPKTKYNWSN